MFDLLETRPLPQQALDIFEPETPILSSRTFFMMSGWLLINALNSVAILRRSYRHGAWDDAAWDGSSKFLMAAVAIQFAAVLFLSLRFILYARRVRRPVSEPNPDGPEETLKAAAVRWHRHSTILVVAYCCLAMINLYILH